MAYTPFRRRPRCGHEHCRARGTDRLYSKLLGIDGLFCAQHALALAHHYPRAIVYRGLARHPYARHGG